MTASGKVFDGEAARRVLNNCCLRVEAEAHHLLAEDVGIGDGVDSH